MTMKPRRTSITKARAVHIAVCHNNVSKEVAEKYTNAELQEVLKHLKIKAIIKN